MFDHKRKIYRTPFCQNFIKIEKKNDR